MAKRPSRGQDEEEIDNGESEAEKGKQAPKKRKAVVEAAAAPKKATPKKKKPAPKEDKPIRKTDNRPMSVGGIIIKTAAEQQSWQKDAPWHRKNNSESRFRDHAPDRRSKD